MTNDFRLSNRLVAAAQLPDEAQRALEAVALRIPSLRESLSQNALLSEEAWMDLYQRKPLPKAGAATALVSRPLSKEQRLHVLDVDRRPAVLAALVEHNALDVDEQQLVIDSKGFGPKLAAILVSEPWMDAGLRKTMALAAQGQVLLDLLADSTPEQFSTEEASELLSRFSEWGPSMDEGSSRGKGQRARSLIRLLGRRPDLLPAAVAAGQHPSVVAAAAGCVHLTDVALQYAAAGLSPTGEPLVPEAELYRLFTDREYALMALVNNPPTSLEVVAAVERLAAAKDMYRLAESASGRARRRPTAITVPYDQISDPEELNWLLRRAIPNLEYQTKARPFELAALARNPHLQRSDAEQVAQWLDTTYCVEVLGDELLPALKALQARPDARTEWLPSVIQRLEDGTYRSEEPWFPRHEEPLAATLVMGRPLRSLEWDMDLNQTLIHVAARLGASTSAWEHFLTLVDEFDGKVEDVVQLSELL